MKNYEEMYNDLNKQFKNYQMFADEKLQRINRINKDLERKLSIFVNIVEVSKYINSNISDSNLLEMINDMIVGMLGVSQSTIHLVENGVLIPKITNIGDLQDTKIHYTLLEINSNKPFIKNSNNGIFSHIDSKNKINSLIGVPIYIKERMIGCIIVEHVYYTFFEEEDVSFIKYIAHQVAIAIENSILYKKIQVAAQTDSLIGIYNRKYFYELIDSKTKSDNQAQFAIVMSDIDNFKMVNDTFGHQFGDLALKTIASVMKINLRDNDIIARYGGEELIMFLDCRNSREEVINQVENIRRQIENTILDNNEDIKSNITVSFGIGF